MTIFKKLSIKVFTLNLLIAAFACTPAVADPAIQITQCGTVITQPGHYILANDLSCGGAPVSGVIGAPNPPNWWKNVQSPLSGSAPVANQPPVSGDGIDILSDHVEVQLNGHTINGGGSGNIGISVGVGVPSGNSHVHIVGPGTITGFSAGVEFEQVTFSSVDSVTVNNNAADFAIGGGFAAGCAEACPSTKNDFTGNTVSVAEFGFLLDGANNNTLRDNSASNSFIGIFLAIAAMGNDVRANTASGNGGGIVLGLFGSGVTDDDITHNTALGNETDLFDANPNCDSNTWKHNTFGSANQPCIQ
jgi:parallel beta-helix repeat protein